MGSYYIPSNKLKGESRILYIFTGKSLIFTAAGAMFGVVFYLFFAAIGIKIVGIIIMALLALIGYGLATFKIPTNGTSKIVKNVGGDSIDEIILHYIMFRKNKKIYSYSVPRKEPDYLTKNAVSSISDLINNTKEDKR